VDACDFELNPSQDASSFAHHPQKGKSKDLRGWQNYTFECSLRHRVTAMLITARSLTLGLGVFMNAKSTVAAAALKNDGVAGG
jgi:hypothetical protein